MKVALSGVESVARPASSCFAENFTQATWKMEELTNIHDKANASTSSKRELIIDIKEMLSTLEPPKSSTPCIYRVPEVLRNLNQEAYTPKVISIGPYHHGKERYKSMEKLKVECLENFWRRTQLNVEDLVDIIMKLEGSVRCCYAEDIKFERNDFAKIILVDASFIVEFLTSSRSISQLDPWLDSTIRKDLLLLENQLPFFVIEELYNLVGGPTCPSFTKVSLSCFVPDKIKILSAIPNLEIKHFLDLFRTSLLTQRPQEENNDQGKKTCTGTLKPIGEEELCINRLRTFLGLHKRRSNAEHEHLEGGTQSHKADNGKDQVESSSNMTHSQSRDQFCDKFHNESQNLPSVTHLHRAGVKLEVSSSEFLLELVFIKGVLKIPKLRIADSTEPNFRNVMAFEQRHYLCNANVTNYTLLLDSLINTTEDVDLLVEKGIIVNWIGDNKAVTILVNNLCKNIIGLKEKKDYYQLSQELKDFHNNRCHRWRAILVRDYFSTPWRIASTLAAVTLLVLTFIQTVCSLVR